MRPFFLFLVVRNQDTQLFPTRTLAMTATMPLGPLSNLSHNDIQMPNLMVSRDELSLMRDFLPDQKFKQEHLFKLRCGTAPVFATDSSCRQFWGALRIYWKLKGKTTGPGIVDQSCMGVQHFLSRKFYMCAIYDFFAPVAGLLFTWQDRAVIDNFNYILSDLYDELWKEWFHDFVIDSDNIAREMCDSECYDQMFEYAHDMTDAQHALKEWLKGYCHVMREFMPSVGHCQRGADVDKRDRVGRTSWQAFLDMTTRY